MASTFDATTTLLEKRFFNGVGVLSDTRSSDMAGECITEIAAEVSRALRAVKVEPDQITEGHAPDAYAWATETILYGAAAEFLRRRPSGDVPQVATDWDEKYRRRLEQLGREPQVVLGDAAVFGSTGSGVRRIYV